MHAPGLAEIAITVAGFAPAARPAGSAVPAAGSAGHRSGPAEERWQRREPQLARPGLREAPAATRPAPAWPGVP